MSFESLAPTPNNLVSIEVGTKPKKTSAASKKLLERGCEFCPSNKKKGINKVFTKVRGKELIIYGMAPGREENKEVANFIGRSGQFLWKELASVGIAQKDCDTQNVVRCFPAEREAGEWITRDPSKEELHCCSLYTEQAIEKTKAKVYIVLGEKAAKQLLGKEYSKTRKIFFSEKLQAKVYCLYHPSYFIRGVYPPAALQSFRDGLKAVSVDLSTKGTATRLSFLEQQHYEAIITPQQAFDARRILRKYAAKGERLTPDIEDDDVDGRRTDLCIGFGYKPGHVKVFVTGHPRARKVNGKWLPLKSKVQRIIRRVAISILEDGKILKALHKGSYDGPQLRKLTGAKLRGYDFDTMYSTYLDNPDARAYGLNKLAIANYPEFGEYKTIIVPEALPKTIESKGVTLTREEYLESNKISPTDYRAQLEFLKKVGGPRLSQLSLKRLVLYNGADCDLTKRFERRTRKKVSMPLLGIYKDASFILDKMEPNGPAFDYEHCEKLKKYYPPLLEKILGKLTAIAGSKFVSKKQLDKEGNRKVIWDNADSKKEFNPGSPIQVRALLFEKLKIPYPIEREYDKKKKEYKLEGTGKKIMERLSRKFEIAQLITDYRRLSKIGSTYLEAYEECARQNNDRLRTKWWLTGTRTGRLSSGGGKKDEEGTTKVINLQNIHGDPNLKNQVCADPQWRKLYNALHKLIVKSVGSKELKRIAVLQETLAHITGIGNASKAKKKEVNAELYGDKEQGKVGLLATLLKKLTHSKRYKRLTKKLIAGALGATLVLLGFDQGQVEVRVMAQLSGDKNLIADCMSSDIHSLVGHAMTGWPVEQIKKDKKTRTLTKNIHFGILFGLGINGLYEFIKAKDPDTDLTEERARELYENYFKRYPGVRRFIEKMRRFVEEHGYVENIFGFKRPLSTAGSSNVSENEEDFDDDSGGGAYWGNQAINTPVQGAAHCLMLMAMAIMHRKKKLYKKLVPTLEIHDYMGFKIAVRDIFETFSLGRKLLEKEPLKLIKKEYPEIKWLIPLVVEGKVGFRLGDDIEADGKDMHQILAEMFLETYIKEVKLDADLEMVA